MLIDQDRWGLSSLRSERFDYVSRCVQGYCLDVGCGRYNTFIKEYIKGNGVGVDVYRYEGLSEKEILKDPSHFPFSNETFDTVTFIASLNHVQSSLRLKELKEAWRCLKPGGNILVTMGNPLAEILVHKLVAFYDRFLGTQFDVDHERGMHEEEAYYLTDREISTLLTKTGFQQLRKKYFFTQWGLNYFLEGKKLTEREVESSRKSVR